ncbi:F-box domain containing protein [Parasponia andersonii]|uniref:F-box domain containing protein n=1 Tax=Parasponia andersonii TaxID=3476 RepID=A0A2P5DPW0_PARAD|nr:F-box domain containing protein [Parasponia andersonii]
MVEENSDSFGRLPDEILCRIISFLPCETALETSFLSTRWRGLWNLASVQQSTVDNIDTAVANFVTCFDKLNPLSHPRLLQLHFGESKVLLATLAANNKLKVDFSAGEKEFPTYFDWKLLLNHQNAANQLCPSTSVYVKALHLKSVDFLTSEAVSSVVSNFQFLESLKIIECNGLRSLYIESSPKLVNLTILDCPHLEFLQLKSSKLRSFRFRGKLPRIWPENHFNLADAMLDFRQGPSTYSLISSDFDPALLTIKNAHVVTLCRWTFETLIWPSLLPMKEAFKFYKLQELWWIDYSEEDYNTDALMYFLKLCPALERLFVTVDPKSYYMPRASTILKKSSRHTQLGNLKVVKLEGFMNQEDENKLVKDIKELVTVEPLIVGASNENCTRILTVAPSPKHAETSL